MYRQILLNKDQTHYNISFGGMIQQKPLKLLTLIYGLAPAFFLATKVRQLTDLEGNQFPYKFNDNQKRFLHG